MGDYDDEHEGALYDKNDEQTDDEDDESDATRRRRVDKALATRHQLRPSQTAVFVGTWVSADGPFAPCDVVAIERAIWAIWGGRIKGIPTHVHDEYVGYVRDELAKRFRSDIDQPGGLAGSIARGWLGRYVKGAIGRREYLTERAHLAHRDGDSHEDAVIELIDRAAPKRKKLAPLKGDELRAKTIAYALEKLAALFNPRERPPWDDADTAHVRTMLVGDGPSARWLAGHHFYSGRLVFGMDRPLTKVEVAALIVVCAKEWPTTAARNPSEVLDKIASGLFRTDVRWHGPHVVRGGETLPACRWRGGATDDACSVCAEKATVRARFRKGEKGQNEHLLACKTRSTTPPAFPTPSLISSQTPPAPTVAASFEELLDCPSRAAQAPGSTAPSRRARGDS